MGIFTYLFLLPPTPIDNDNQYTGKSVLVYSWEYRQEVKILLDPCLLFYCGNNIIICLTIGIWDYLSRQPASFTEIITSSLKITLG